MNTEMIAKTEAFLKDTFAASTYLQANPTDRDYRLEHSYRVANIAKTIAETEGFNVALDERGIQSDGNRREHGRQCDGG